MTIKRSDSESSYHREGTKCFELHGSSSATIDFFTGDKRVYGFPYHHLINYVLDANPNLDRNHDAPPERLTLAFSSHDAVVLGWRLQGLLQFLHDAKISTVRSFDARYANLGDVMPFIAEIIVTPAKGAS
jgi:hypothetical protein